MTMDFRNRNVSRNLAESSVDALVGETSKLGTVAMEE